MISDFRRVKTVGKFSLLFHQNRPQSIIRNRIMIKPFIVLSVLAAMGLAEPSVLPHFVPYDVSFQCGNKILETRSASIQFSDESSKFVMVGSMSGAPEINILCNKKEYKFSNKINNTFTFKAKGLKIIVTPAKKRK